MELGHFLYECPWIPEKIRKKIMEARAALEMAEARPPWSPPDRATPEVPTRRAEEQSTMVRFEPATGADGHMQRAPVPTLKPSTAPQDAASKHPQKPGPSGVRLCHVSKREVIIPSNLTVREAFLTENLDSPPIPSCIRNSRDMHALAAGFPNFELNAYVRLDKFRGQPTQVVLDTGA